MTSSYFGNERVHKCCGIKRYYIHPLSTESLMTSCTWFVEQKIKHPNHQFNFKWINTHAVAPAVFLGYPIQKQWSKYLKHTVGNLLIYLPSFPVLQRCFLIYDTQSYHLLWNNNIRTPLLIHNIQLNKLMLSNF